MFIFSIDRGYGLGEKKREEAVSTVVWCIKVLYLVERLESIAREV